MNNKYLALKIIFTEVTSSALIYVTTTIAPTLD